MTEPTREELVLQWRVKSGQGTYYREWMDTDQVLDVHGLPSAVAALMAFEMIRDWKSKHYAHDEEQRVIMRQTVVTEELVLDG